MKCEAVQQELHSSRPEEIGRFTRGCIRRHLGHCAVCSDAAAQLSRLEAEVQALYPAAPPPDLQARIAGALASVTQQVPASPSSVRAAYLYPRIRFWQNRAVRWSYSLTLAASLALCLLFIFRNQSAAAAIRRMQAAVGHVHSAHLITWWREGSHQEGALQPVEEFWYQDGCWRKTSRPDAGGDRIIRDGATGKTYYHYDLKQGKVIAMTETGQQTDTFSFNTLAGDYFPIGADMRIRKLDRLQEGEDVLDEMLVEMPAGQERMLFWVEEATDLPLRAEKQVWTGGQWYTVGKIWFEFNRLMPASLFDPHSLEQKPGSIPGATIDTGTDDAQLRG